MSTKIEFVDGWIVLTPEAGTSEVGVRLAAVVEVRAHDDGDRGRLVLVDTNRRNYDAYVASYEDARTYATCIRNKITALKPAPTEITVGMARGAQG